MCVADDRDARGDRVAPAQAAQLAGGEPERDVTAAARGEVQRRLPGEHAADVGEAQIHAAADGQAAVRPAHADAHDARARRRDAAGGRADRARRPAEARAGERLGTRREPRHVSRLAAIRTPSVANGRARADAYDSIVDSTAPERERRTIAPRCPPTPDCDSTLRRERDAVRASAAAGSPSARVNTRRWGRRPAPAPPGARSRPRRRSRSARASRRRARRARARPRPRSHVSASTTVSSRPAAPARAPCVQLAYRPA
jgi:hypothetical protein